MSWNLSVGSLQVVPGWDAEAARLRRFLDVITTQVAIQHDEPLQWRNETMTVEQWNDLDAITAEVLKQRLRTEDGKRLFSGGRSSSVVLGHLSGAKDNLINCRWGLGGDREVQFSALLHFYTEIDGSLDGGARPLNEYPASWLAQLVAETAQCVAAVESSISTMGIFKALRKVRKEARGRVGAVNLVPHGIGDAQLPDSISVFPCPSEVHPNGVVLAVDLDTAFNEPAAVVDDMLIIDDILTATNP